jgi:presenilin 1
MLLPLLLLLLQCYKIIYGYMGFAMFNVFFFLTGALIIQLLRISGVHMDLVSFCFLLFNFSVSACPSSSTYQ